MNKPEHPLKSIPSGWYQVAYSDELKPEQVMPLDYFGKKLVMFRSTQGEAKILDAYCRHMGSHMGYGGKVSGECIQCPYHGWEYNGHGECSSIPACYLEAGDKIPKLKVQAWPVAESSGILWTYYDPHHGQPLWRPPSFPEYGSENWHGYEKKVWNVHTHIQDFGENFPDAVHFQFVHGAQEPPNSVTSVEGEQGQVFKVVSKMREMFPDGIDDLTVESHAYGLGLWTFRISRANRQIFLIAGLTPVDHQHVVTRASYLLLKDPVQKKVSDMAMAGFHFHVYQVEQDLDILENKIYIENPPLLKKDSPIYHFREWARQFYSD